MKLLRSLLLLLLTLTVPVSGFASVTMSHCKDMQQSKAVASAPVHDMAMMGDMSGMDHEHMHHGDMQKSSDSSKASSSCKCGCPCKGHCASSSCSVAAALIPKSLKTAELQSVKKIGQATTPHALTPHHLDRLRPPITAAT